MRFFLSHSTLMLVFGLRNIQLLLLLLNLFICFSAHITLFVHNTVHYKFSSVHFFVRKRKKKFFFYLNLIIIPLASAVRYLSHGILVCLCDVHTPTQTPLPTPPWDLSPIVIFQTNCTANCSGFRVFKYWYKGP